MGTRLTGATAIVTLTFQLIVSAAGVVTLCVDTPHTHSGVPAPDCPMHHQQPPAATTDGHQSHQAGAHHDTHSAGSRIECRCSSDAPSLAIGVTGVVADSICVRVPMAIETAVSTFDATTIDIPIAPLAPPPRHLLS